MDFAYFIAGKGVRALSDAINRPCNTIYGWTHWNYIPRDIWPELLITYPEIGLNDLLTWERSRKQRA